MSSVVSSKSPQGTLNSRFSASPTMSNRSSPGGPNVPVITEGDPTALGLPLIGTSSHEGEPYVDADLTGPLALVIGSEAHGVPDDIRIDRWITIPHAGRGESLNAAMAATLLVFEVRRQIRETGAPRTGSGG